MRWRCPAFPPPMRTAPRNQAHRSAVISCSSSGNLTPLEVSFDDADPDERENSEKRLKPPAVPPEGNSSMLSSLAWVAAAPVDAFLRFSNSRSNAIRTLSCARALCAVDQVSDFVSSTRTGIVFPVDCSTVRTRERTTWKCSAVVCIPLMFAFVAGSMKKTTPSADARFWESKCDRRRGWPGKSSI